MKKLHDVYIITERQTCRHRYSGVHLINSPTKCRQHFQRIAVEGEKHFNRFQQISIDFNGICLEIRRCKRAGQCLAARHVSNQQQHWHTPIKQFPAPSSYSYSSSSAASSSCSSSCSSRFARRWWVPSIHLLTKEKKRKKKKKDVSLIYGKVFVFLFWFYFGFLGGFFMLFRDVSGIVDDGFGFGDFVF